MPTPLPLHPVGRRLCGVLLIWLLAAPALAATVTDLAGRSVVLPERVEGIVLGEGRYIPALAILEGEAVDDRLVGLLPDFERTDPAGYAQYLARFPALDEVPRVGHASADSFSLERVLTLGADLAIFGLEGHGPGARHQALIERLERAGVTVLFVDFRQDPLRNTPRSMALLGEALGRQAEAERFNRFYLRELARVEETVAEIPDDERPTVFLHSRAGLHAACCETMADGMLGRFIEAAGGRNLALAHLPGVSGVLNLETLLEDPPARYVATAIGTPQHRASERDRPYVVLGAGVDPTLARASLARVVARPGLRALEAIREERVFALWHHFYNTPLNVVAVQALARWLHPERCTVLAPHATLARFYADFQPVDLDGTYWIALAGATP